MLLIDEKFFEYFQLQGMDNYLSIFKKFPALDNFQVTLHALSQTSRDLTCGILFFLLSLYSC